MGRTLLLILILATSVLAEKCEFDLGELNQYVVTYDVRVTNISGPASPAVVTVRMKGATRSATLFSKQTLAVTSFAGGDYTVTVGHLGLRLVQLRNRRDQIKVQIDTARVLRPNEVAELEVQLKAVMDVLANLEAGRGGTTCKGTVQPGKTVAILVSDTGGNWSC